MNTARGQNGEARRWGNSGGPRLNDQLQPDKGSDMDNLPSIPSVTDTLRTGGEQGSRCSCGSTP
jgi:hypothetical protein